MQMNINKKIKINILAAAINPLWYLKVVRGSGRLRRYVFSALVIVLLSHSKASSRFNFSNFRRSNPRESNLDTFEVIPTTLYRPCSSNPIQVN